MFYFLLEICDEIILIFKTSSSSSPSRQDFLLLFQIEHGADISVVNEESETAIHVAAREGRDEVLKHLLQRGVTTAVFFNATYEKKNYLKPFRHAMLLFESNTTHHWTNGPGRPSILKNNILLGIPCFFFCPALALKKLPELTAKYIVVLQVNVTNNG